MHAVLVFPLIFRFEGFCRLTGGAWLLGLPLMALQQHHHRHSHTPHTRAR